MTTKDSRDEDDAIKHEIHKRCGAFSIELEEKYGIRVVYIGTNTNGGIKESALQVTDLRIRKDRDRQMPLEELLWDYANIDAIAEKNKMRVTDIDTVSGEYLHKYRHGGRRYQSLKSVDVLFVQFQEL